MPEFKDSEIALRFKALSHPRRALIFRLMTENPEICQSYSQLQVATRLSPSSLVHHLREMERCGLIRRQRKGVYVTYFLTTNTLADANRNVLGLCSRRSLKTHRAA